MTDTAAPSFDPRFTVLVLPGGHVHADGTLRSGPQVWPLIHEAWRVPCEAAKRLGRAVRVSVGRADGSVAAYLMSGDGGHQTVTSHPELFPLMVADPRWSDGMLGQHPLLAQVHAADTSGDLAQARRAARYLTDQMEQGVGKDHPYSVLARELEGHFALRAQDWLAACGHYALAAETRYRLQSPANQTSTALDNAVAAWLAARSGSQDPDVMEAGYGLGHLVLRTAPRRADCLTAVLERLTPANA
ncbi:hypothetical protein CTZ27_30920 [Streptomyces griseocarneus]|nr:hypothetical protein CTZ27_30920 [Streptomyces griseocarneus]